MNKITKKRINKIARIFRFSAIIIEFYLNPINWKTRVYHYNNKHGYIQIHLVLGPIGVFIGLNI